MSLFDLRIGWNGYKELDTSLVFVFITLKSIYEQKKDLQALVVDKNFIGHRLGRSAYQKVVNVVILDFGKISSPRWKL